MEDFRSFYLPDRGDWERSEVSPLLMADGELGRMPPSLIVTAGCDPLREDGEAYANRLRANRVAVTYRMHQDMIHAFLNFYNAQLFPRISPCVEPLLDAAAVDIGKSLMANESALH